ncbi:MAG: hypothetical protein HFG41_02685 [Coprococcus sp.]|nr:hypothetical protein [Coprococcus sp.]
MRKDYRKIGVISAAVLGMAGLLGMASIQESKDASAYFTTYVSAGGSQVVNMGAQTEIHEDVSRMTKHVSVMNTSQINDCYVRVKVFHSGDLNITYEDTSEAGNLWTYSDADGYWYYGPILEKGASTEIFDIKIGDLPDDFDKDSFNVVVIQECTPVIYNAQGNPTADWNTIYDEYQKVQGEGDDE